jgi:hypothetical protein
MFRENLVGLEELIRLGKGTVFVPFNVGGPTQGELRIILSIDETTLRHVSLIPKWKLEGGKLVMERRYCEINLIKKNLEYYKFILIDDVDSLLKDVADTNACLN